MQGLKDETIIVTGGGGGIGSATCRRLARGGAKVAVFDRNFHARNGSRRSGPHHGGITANPVRAQARKVGDCLDEVRLALPVSSDNEIRAGFEGNLGDLVVTKIAEG